MCLAQAPAAAHRNSVDGKLGCLMPYIDIHLADVAAFPGRFSYIHQTDLQYAGHFPLGGVMHLRPDGVLEDVRRRIPFGHHTYIWVPQPKETGEYLGIVYGSSWRVTLVDRFGVFIYNDTDQDGASFWGQIAKPTGPFDAIGEKLQS